MKQSFAWAGFARGSTDPETLIRVAAEIGYSGIEMAPVEHWQRIRDHGMTLVNTQGHPLIPEGLNRLENYAAIEQSLRKKLALASQWQMPNLICFSGDRMGLDDQTGLDNTVKNLERLMPLAEDAGINLHLEVLNSKVDHPDYQADHSSWAIEVCQRVDSPRLKLLYDIYHMQIMEGDIIRTIKTQQQYIGHYHSAGNPGRQDLDDAQELHYPAIFKAIAQTGFDGFIGHEFRPKADPLKALEDAFALTQAHALL